MKLPQVSILEGITFVVSDMRGDIAPDPDEPTGLFYRDVRHLSRWQVRLNGNQLDALSGEEVEYDEAVFFLVEPTGTIYRNPTVSLLRRRHVGDGMRETLELTSHSTTPLTLELSILFAADFADIFEIKDRLQKTGRSYRRVGPGDVTMVYERGAFRRETVVRAANAFFTEESATFRITLQPRQTWRTEVEVGVATERVRPVVKRIPEPNMPYAMQEWIDAAPRLDTGWDDLRRVYQRSLVDLAALRFYPDSVPDSSLPAAGLPWFMALFGRDSLITSYQALPFVPEMCRTTLRALAAQQATALDDFRDAEPGKILHELRQGELVHFGERPQSPYYGTADATPLFLIVLDEYERWTGDRETVQALEGAARAALTWMERYGDLDGDGFIEYLSRNPETGLRIQCWKDSWNSIVYPDGTPAPLPHATCEIQGYAYDARRRMARLARECWEDMTLAERLERDADALRKRFHETFWLPDEGFYALARDGHGRPVPTLASNIGHLLWSGIVPDENVDQVVEHLMGENLFSGWGVRTVAAGQRAYNPMEYHNGTVWPHDNALIAMGLTRYGRHTEAARLAEVMLEAAPYFQHRLPEALIGTDRAATGVPVAYTAACSPQAWASGTPLLLLRSMMGLEPRRDGLGVDGHVPLRCGHLALSGIPGWWGRVDAFSLGTVAT
ncbi:amylo-alpha-1,6-glucosidase [Planosporangium flavigriseum]|uniref:Amylo-alpha-1,6-glucosidase n=1 Tax=Planosporangium flavigriseum TaxID=373681 RepID=A0A8J3LU87_9ACTN|nr:glycogen debranching N-terminal domain-containing protein [Planosporangium flavigriseum]GIG73716.1 amylo-alpha-1,6-glucosidase [Planosporangium flavigriseum]